MNSGHYLFIKAIQQGVVSVASEINLGTELENLPLVLGLLRDLVCPLYAFFCN